MQKTEKNNSIEENIKNNFFKESLNIPLKKKEELKENKIKNFQKTFYKKLSAIKIIKESMEIISIQTRKNPLKILLDAVNNSIINNNINNTIPNLKKINLGIYFIIKEAKEESFKKQKNISECLAYKIIKLSKS
jgi:ribosomal protein S7